MILGSYNDRETWYRKCLQDQRDVLIHFYKNDGPGGSPGSVLWNRGVFDDLPHTSEINTYTFRVPDIVVPDTFIWTVQLSDRKGSTGSMGPAVYDPPTAGSSEDFIWSFFDGKWNKINDPDVIDNLGARVSAVPEPATVATTWFWVDWSCRILEEV